MSLSVGLSLGLLYACITMYCKRAVDAAEPNTSCAMLQSLRMREPKHSYGQAMDWEVGCHMEEGLADVTDRPPTSPTMHVLHGIKRPGVLRSHQKLRVPGVGALCSEPEAGLLPGRAPPGAAGAAEPRGRAAAQPIPAGHGAAEPALRGPCEMTLNAPSMRGSASLLPYVCGLWWTCRTREVCSLPFIGHPRASSCWKSVLMHCSLFTLYEAS